MCDPALVPGANQCEGMAQAKERTVGQAGNVVQRRVIAEDDEPLDGFWILIVAQQRFARMIVSPADERTLRVARHCVKLSHCPLEVALRGLQSADAETNLLGQLGSGFLVDRFAKQLEGAI